MIHGNKIANQSGLNKSKTSKGQKQNVVMNNDTRVQIHRQRISLHYLIDVMVESNGRTSNAPWAQ